MTLLVSKGVLQDGAVGCRLTKSAAGLSILYSKPGGPSSAIVVKKFSSGRNRTTFEQKTRVHDLR